KSGPPAPVLVPEWSVVTEDYPNDPLDANKRIVAIHMVFGNMSARWAGNPADVNACVTWNDPDGKVAGRRYQNAFGREVPAHIAEEYKRIWKNNEHLRLRLPSLADANKQMTKDMEEAHERDALRLRSQIIG